MIRFNVTVITFMLAVLFSSAYAETYSWTDEKGTIHFTEDPGKVPEKIRGKVRSMDEAGSVREEKTVPKALAGETPDVTPRNIRSDGNDNDGIYAGKPYAQWQKELAEREAAMGVIRKRIDEIAGMLNKFSNNWDEQKKLLLEHKSLSVQFKEMKAEYFQQVEIARKAGLTVNIQE